MTNRHPEPGIDLTAPAVTSPATTAPTQPVDRLPAAGTPYALFLQGPHSPRGWWRGLLALLALGATMLIASGVLQTAAVLIEIAVGARAADFSPEALMTLTPGTLLATNLSLIAMLPVAFWMQKLLFGQSGATLHSVLGRFRWRLLGRLALILVPLFAVYSIGMTLLFPQSAGITENPATLTSAVAMIVVVVLTTPFQAAAEEYAFRGLGQRAVASWFRSPQAALIVSTVAANALFMLAHGAGDWTLMIYYFVFGLAGTVIAHRTGGLEGAVALHAVNNVVLFITAALQSSQIVMDRSAGTGGAFMLIPGAMIVLATVIVCVVGRREQRLSA